MKVIALTPRGYVKDIMNITDGIIVLMTIVEICKILYLAISTGVNVKAFRSLRIFRTLRVIRITRVLLSLEYIHVILKAIS